MNLRKNFILIYVLFYSAICFSQSQVDSTTDYDKAIQFYIINQVIAAYKHHLTDKSALRFTVNATGLFNDKDADHIEYRERTTDTVGYFENRETKNSNQFFEIKLQYLHSANVNKIVKLFFGGGPFVNYQFNQNEEWYESYNSNSIERYKGYYKWNNNIWSLGLSAVVGLECVVYDNIILFTEYEATVNRSWQTNDYFSANQTYNSNNHDYDIWSYELKGLRIGLGIYF